VTIDLAVLALLLVASLRGAFSGALRQVVSLAAVGVGVFAARAFGREVGEGLARSLAWAGRFVAPVLLFAGAFALASLAGAALLHATGVSRVVRGPADRGAGALLGGAKAALAAWLVLSALALADDVAPAPLAARARESDFAALARAHNLVARIDPGAARALDPGAR
jgi:membrane protein required for colicin V production